MNPVARLRSALARLLGLAAERLDPASESFDRIPKGAYDYVPKGTCVFGPADRFLLVPKNRYRVVLLPGQSAGAELGVGWITEENTPDGYDRLWGDAGNLEAFRAEGEHVRDKLTVEIIDAIVADVGTQANVVDIGCGVGDLLVEMRKRRPGVSVSGLDFSARAIQGAKAILPDGTFVQHVIERELPYPDATFDVVLCTDVLEHLEHPLDVASELVRICRPGGIVAIVVPDGDVDQFFGHIWFWNQESLTRLLSPWKAQVMRLPETREFLALIRVAGGAAP